MDKAIEAAATTPSKEALSEQVFEIINVVSELHEADALDKAYIEVLERLEIIQLEERERCAAIADKLGADRVERDESGELQNYDLTCKRGRSDAMLNAMRVRAHTIATAIRQQGEASHER